MKRCFKMVALALAVILSLTACKKTQQADTQQTATTSNENSQTKASSLSDDALTFTVGVDASYPPYDFRDKNGNAIGFDVDIIKAIGEKQGFGVNVVAKDWDGLVADFEKGVYDISISGYSDTEERQQRYLVSRPYSFGQDVVVTKKGGAVTQSINNADQLKPLKVAVQGNSPYEEQLKGYGVNQLVAKSTSFLAFQTVVRGEADAMVVDNGVVHYYISQLEGGTPIDFEFHKLAGEDFERYELVILTPKDKTELMEKINQGIVDIIQDGTYATIYKKWFGIEPTEQDIPKIK